MTMLYHIFFPEFPDHHQKMCQGRNHQRNKNIETAPTIPLPSPSKVVRTIGTKHQYSTSEATTSDKSMKLNEKMKTLEER